MISKYRKFVPIHQRLFLFLIIQLMYSLLKATHSILHHSQLSRHNLNPLSPFKNSINMHSLFHLHFTEWSQTTGRPPVLAGTTRPSGVVPCRAAPPRTAAPAVKPNPERLRLVKPLVVRTSVLSGTVGLLTHVYSLGLCE